MTYSWHEESHFINRSNWLRAMVLGANDGLISSASLLMGMVASNSEPKTLLLTGVAGLVSGAISMSAGEYISVSSQADTEKADLRKESLELARNPECELRELEMIYENRGLSSELAHQVAIAFTEHDALGAHARDEMRMTEVNEAKPLQASLASGFSFCCGTILPVLITLFAPLSNMPFALGASTLGGLAVLGVVSAKLGGAKPLPAVSRIVFWDILALTTTYFIGHAFGVGIVS